MPKSSQRNNNWVTRREPALAISRLVAGYQVLVVVVSNGEDAEIKIQFITDMKVILVE